MHNERREQEPFTGCPLSPLPWGMAILPQDTTEGNSAFIHTRWVIRTYLFLGALGHSVIASRCFFGGEAIPTAS